MVVLVSVEGSVAHKIGGKVASDDNM